MNRILFALIVLVLFLPAAASAQWAGRVDNFYDKLLDSLTFTNPPDTAVPVFSTATKKWSAIAGGGGGGSDASTVTKGVTKLTVPPASATSPIAVGANDPSVNPTPTAANAGNIPVVPTGGGAMTHIDPPAGTDTSLFSTGTNTPPAFRIIATADVDEILALTDLTGVSATTGSGTTVPLATSPTITTPTLVTPTVTNTGTTVTVWHGNATGGTGFGVVTPSDAAGNTSGSGNFVLANGPTFGTFVTWTDVAGSPASTGRFNRNGANLEFHDGTAARVMEKQSNKDAASGYAGLTAATKINIAQGQEVWASTDLSDVSALGGTSQSLGASASNGSGSAIALSNHVHKGIVAQSAASNLDGGNGNATLNVSGTFVTPSASSGTVTVVVEPPTGSIMIWPAATPPVGWALCRGGAVSRTGATAALFAVIGTTYGAGDGSTTFNLPDCGGRVIAGSESAATRLTSGGSGISGSTLGAAGGTQTHTLLAAEIPDHTHSGTTTSTGSTHSHSATGSSITEQIQAPTSNSRNYMQAAGTTATDTSGSHTHTFTSSTSSAGGGAHQNTQPTIVMNYIIKI